MLNSDLDCLFVHVPKADNHYLPLGDFFNITYMPMGLLAIADLLERRGHNTEVIHLGVEWLNDRSFHLVDAMADTKVRALGLPLYWHYQSYDVIEVARAFKAANPDTFVFLGGLTAGYFASEIIEEFPFIDGVLRGHAEGSASLLIDALSADEELSAVPGLTYRAGDGTVLQNPGHLPRDTPAAPPLDELVFANLSVLRNAEVYARSFGFPLAYGRELSPVQNLSKLSMGRAFFPLFIGRGCPWSCTFCGGNRDTLKRVNGTSKVQFRSPEAVVADIRRAMSYGYKTMALCFDPVPQKDTYYRRLFEHIRDAELDVDFYFECWGLPTEDFLIDFRRTFPSEESYVALSPDAGNEALRKKNKQPFYTNAQLFETLDRLEEMAITFDVFYTIALPGETIETARETQQQIELISSKYRRARRLMTWSVQLEPGSPQFERPESFHMETDRNRFIDFYRVHGGDRADTYSSLGYKIQGYFGDARDQGSIGDFERHLQHLKCMEFCFLGRDPRFWNSPADGRKHCFERRKDLATQRGTSLPTRAIGEGHDYFDAVREERALRGERPRFGWV